MKSSTDNSGRGDQGLELIFIRELLLLTPPAWPRPGEGRSRALALTRPHPPADALKLQVSFSAVLPMRVLELPVLPWGHEP